jgi:hypothetical protein
VLKHSGAKITEFLHSQHSDKLTNLQLPRPDQSFHFFHVGAICSKFETLDAYNEKIDLHNGVSIRHRKHEHCQRVNISPFPSRRCHDFNRMDFLFILFLFCVQIMITDTN